MPQYFATDTMWGTICRVFDAWYIAMAVAIAGFMAFALLHLSEFVFLEPHIAGHIPPGTETGFALILAISIISGLVIPMNIYRMRRMRSAHIKMGGGFAGSLIGTVAGACSCGPAGFAVISTFGSLGSAAASFLTNYEIPIRTAALGILLVSMYTTSRSLRAECHIRE